jgi:hypothetical protein
MEEKELAKLLRQYMPADSLHVCEPDPLLVIEARLTVSARKERARLYKFWCIISQGGGALRQMAASIILLCFAAGFLWLDSGRIQSGETQDSTGASVITSSISTTTLSVISSTMLTSIPTLRN